MSSRAFAGSFSQQGVFYVGVPCGGGVDLEDKENSMNSVINKISGIAAETSISSDKVVQEHGNQLRKLIEQLKQNIAEAEQKTAE